jgi:hypothetical protein
MCAHLFKYEPISASLIALLRTRIFYWHKMRFVAPAVTPVGPGHPYGEVPPHPARDAQLRRDRPLPMVPPNRLDHHDVTEDTTGFGSDRFPRSSVRPHGSRTSGKRRRSQESAVARQVKPKPLPSSLPIPVNTRSLPTYSNPADCEVGKLLLALHSQSVSLSSRTCHPRIAVAQLKRKVKRTLIPPHVQAQR